MRNNHKWQSIQGGKKCTVCGLQVFSKQRKSKRNPKLTASYTVYKLKGKVIGDSDTMKKVPACPASL